MVHFPDKHYLRWFGNFILSKSCENKIVCWQPKLVTAKPSSIPEQSEVEHTTHTGVNPITLLEVEPAQGLNQ